MIYDDLNDNIDDIFAGIAPAAPRVVKPAEPAPLDLDWGEAEAEDAQGPREFVENCSKCGGRGRFVSYSGRVLGSCFACKGVGHFVRKTSPEQRAKARVQAVDRKVRTDRETLAAFAAEQPAIAAWIEARRERFEFAQAMHDAIIKFGSLTERQIATCERLAASDAARAAESQARVASAPTVETDRLMAAFDAAKARGIKRPKMRFEGFQASLAGAESRNAGAVYLKDGETYLGKIAGGKLQASRECSDAQRAAIVSTMADPLAAAVAYGRRTGACSICGRELTVKESIDRGIGPICAERFGL